MKEIELSNSNYKAQVSEIDYEHLSRHQWHLHRDGYVCRWELDDSGVKKLIMMHREIMSPPADLVVDHINRDKINNTRDNLRLCTRQENSCNRVKSKNHLGYKGVSKSRDRWQARIRVDYKCIYLGKFNNEIAAANAYNYFAKQYHGDFASLNDAPFMERDEWESYKV